MNLADLRVLITGGASGLGRATAQRFHDAGAHVVIADLATSAGKEVAPMLGDRASFVPTDVTSEQDVREAVAHGSERQAAGRRALRRHRLAMRILRKKGVHDLDRYRTVIEINLIGTFNVLRLAAGSMSANELHDGDRGVVIMTASIAAFDGQIGQAAYSSSKAGVHGLTLTAARDLAEYGIRVCAIAPGIFETPMLLDLPQAAQDPLGAQIPHPSRLGKPDEFARLAAHIVENPMLNGETIRLDGAIRMPPK